MNKVMDLTYTNSMYMHTYLHIDNCYSFLFRHYKACNLSLISCGVNFLNLGPLSCGTPV